METKPQSSLIGYVPAIVLLTGLMLSALGALMARHQSQSQDRLRLQLVTERVQSDATERLGKYVSLVRSAVGFFEASGLKVSAAQFRRFWAAAKLETNFPGILALAYVEKVPAPRRAEFEAEHRRRVPEFHIFPETPRDPYYVVTFVEPSDDHRKTSLGFDPFTEPIRRSALEAARDSGSPVMSNRVILKTEEGQERAAPAFLLYAPIYSTPSAPPTVEERRRALHGYIGASFRVDELLDGIRGPSARTQVAFRIFAGKDVNPSNLLMVSKDFPLHPTGLRRVDTISVEGVPWTFEYVTLPGFQTESDRAMEVAGLGILLSLLLYGFTSSQVQARRADERALHHERARAQDLQDLDRVKTRLFSNLSHELRTPLNGILGMTDLLWDTPLTEVQKDYLTTIGTCGKTLLDLISDVLDVSKIEAGKLELKKRPFKLRQPFTAALEVVRGQARGKDLELDLQWHSELPLYVKGDLVRLRQVLVNLLSNAVKFTSHGAVTLRARPQTGGMEIEIQDTGVGISAENQEKLFRPFSQVAMDGAEPNQGTGLGLAISKELVHLMGGTISLSSQLGVGSVFKISLPLDVEDADKYESVTTPNINKAVEGGLRLLVADDNPVNLRVLLLQLQKLGYSADGVEDGQKAVEAAGQTAYDLILMDCQMPVMDGLEATRVLRRTLQPSPIIVALTAHAQPEQQAECEAAGMDDFLTKPIELARLVTVLDKWRSKLKSEEPASEETGS